MSEQKPGPTAIRDARGRLLGGSALNKGGRGRPIENWRGWLRRNTEEGTEIHKILLDLARGVPRAVKLLDGRETVIVPTAEVSARVAIHLDEMLHGKAVTQNEQQRAEREASAMEAVRALSDSELARRAAQALSRGTDESDAEIVSCADELWEAHGSNGLTFPLEEDE